jgi:hypothetical protein
MLLLLREEKRREEKRREEKRRGAQIEGRERRREDTNPREIGGERDRGRK